MTDIVLEPALDAKARAELADLAHVIWHEHYPDIISRAQIDYMLARDYDLPALEQAASAGVAFTLARRQSHENEARTALGFSALAPPDEHGHAWLDKLYVHVEVRGLGIGAALIAAALQQAAAAGASRLRLRVNRHNARAVAVYHNAGFAIEAEDIKDIGQGFVMDDYLMGRGLPRD